MMLTNADTEVFALPLSRCSRIGCLAFRLASTSTIFSRPAGKDFVEVIGGAMKFLRADDQIHVG